MNNNNKYLVLSDIHAHEWTQFATVNSEGVNTRLLILCEAILEADGHGYNEGCRTMFIPGDLFHKRGELTPMVINLIKETLIKCKIPRIIISSGNHDETLDESSSLHSALACMLYEHPTKSIEPVIDHPVVITLGKMNIACFPWRPNPSFLLDDMAEIRSEVIGHLDAMCHVGVESVLPNLKGIDSSEIVELNYDRVFAGHYHNHKELPGNVYSVGALTHQTWRDVGSKAGYLIVSEDEVKHYETSAPKFMDFDEAMADHPRLAEGNYIRVRSSFDSKSDATEIRDFLIDDLGAAGVQIHPEPKGKGVIRNEDLELELEKTEDAIHNWVDWKFGDDPDKEEVQEICDQAYKGEL